MLRVTVEKIEIDRCPRCGGVWLDALEKDRLQVAHAAAKAETPGKPQPVPRPKDLHCPKDKSLMIRMVDLRQPHVHFESCKICGGMFFDAGELKDLNKLTIMERIRSALGMR
jgi:Zn-finger nucleic acid-binding protein